MTKTYIILFCLLAAPLLAQNNNDKPKYWWLNTTYGYTAYQSIAQVELSTTQLGFLLGVQYRHQGGYAPLVDFRSGLSERPTVNSWALKVGHLWEYKPLMVLLSGGVGMAELRTPYVVASSRGFGWQFEGYRKELRASYDVNLELALNLNVLKTGLVLGYTGLVQSSASPYIALSLGIGKLF